MDAWSSDPLATSRREWRTRTQSLVKAASKGVISPEFIAGLRSGVTGGFLTAAAVMSISTAWDRYSGSVTSTHTHTSHICTHMHPHVHPATHTHSHAHIHTCAHRCLRACCPEPSSRESLCHTQDQEAPEPPASRQDWACFENDICRCPSTGRKKSSRPYDGILLSKKRNKVLIHATWMTLKSIVLNERCQTVQVENRSVVARG